MESTPIDPVNPRNLDDLIVRRDILNTARDILETMGLVGPGPEAALSAAHRRNDREIQDAIVAYIASGRADFGAVVAVNGAYYSLVVGDAGPALQETIVAAAYDVPIIPPG